MVNQPSPAVGQGARPPVAGAVAMTAGRSIAPWSVPEAPAGTSSAQPGAELYEIYCVPCHGRTGAGIDAPVAHYFPRVGDLTSADVQRHDDDWLYSIVANGTPVMPSYGHELEPDERSAIVRFVRTLAR